jgi:dihydrofolate reductase
MQRGRRRDGQTSRDIFKGGTSRAPARQPRGDDSQRAVASFKTSGSRCGHLAVAVHGWPEPPSANDGSREWHGGRTRKLIESTLVSLDGVIGDPPAWAFQYFDASAEAAALQQLQASDGFLMGRNTYEMFSKVWPALTSDYAAQLNTMPKYVFSSTLDSADWSNTTIVRDDVTVAVRELKEEDGRDLVMYGHGPLGETLLENGLLDELFLSIHPVFVGHGTLLFREARPAAFRLVDTRTLQNGVVVCTYQPSPPDSNSI